MLTPEQEDFEERVCIIMEGAGLTLDEAKVLAEKRLNNTRHASGVAKRL